MRMWLRILMVLVFYVLVKLSPSLSNHSKSTLSLANNDVVIPFVKLIH
jgi:hypothetical protein